MPRKISRKQHQQDGQIERTEEYRVDDRKGREQPCADDDEPRLVAVPERRNRIHHADALVFFLRAAEQNADTQIEPVENHVDQNRQRDCAGPEQRQTQWFGAAHGVVFVPVAEPAESANANGRLEVAPGIGRAFSVGPSCSSL